MTNYSFIGGGNMAKAIIAGMLKSGIAMTQILATTRTKESADKLSDTYGIHTSQNNIDALNADVIVLSVKPQVVFEVLAAMDKRAFAEKLVISVMAGVRVEQLQPALHASTRIVRTMPNTPAFVGAGMTGLFSHNATENDKAIANQLFSAVGNTLWVETEQGIDLVNAISGSGPAYFFEFIKAVAQSGEKLGLSPSDSVMLAVNTAKGAALLAEKNMEKQTENNTDLQTLIDQVTSKGGTTIEAINAFREQDLDGVVDTAIHACYRRVLTLSDNLANKD